MDSEPERDEAEDGQDEEAVVTPLEEDLAMQGAVMRVLLVEHPTQMTISDLELELFQSEGGEHEVEIEDTVMRLAAVGLVHRHGQFVIPTRAALYYDSLNFD